MILPDLVTLVAVASLHISKGIKQQKINLLKSLIQAVKTDTLNWGVSDKKSTFNLSQTWQLTVEWQEGSINILFTIDCSKPAPFVYFRPFHNAKTVWKFCQITLTVGGRNTVQLVSCLTRLDLTNKENMLFVGSGAVESKLVKLETSRTVKLPQCVSVPWFNNLHDVVVLKIWTQ